ncbi:MAG: SDR family oxidoreductase, partial [Bacteroidia bacterium]|nr:SDR family oxidoreductase [Bacteroidia bacterium]
MISLKDKTILVTGASSGIGKDSAILFSEIGATVIITARRENELKNTLSLMKENKHQWILCDATKPNEVRELVNKMPAIDGWLHCTGKVFPVPFTSSQDKPINDFVSVNPFSAIYF